MPRALLKFFVILLVFSLAGCSSFLWGKKGQRAENAQGAVWRPTMSDLELKSRLRSGFDLFAMRVIATGEQVAAQCPDPGIRRKALFWKSMVVPAYGSMVTESDPRVSLMDIITFTTAMRKTFETGEGRDMFGPCQPLVVKVARDSEQDALRIAGELLPPKEFAAMRKEVEAWVDAKKPYNVYGQTRVDRQAGTPDKDRPEPTGLMESIPLAAFQMLEGIDNATQAVREMGRVGERLAQMAEYAPTYSRWSMELLAYDLLQTDQISAAVEGLKSLSSSASRLVALGEGMPKDLRKNMDLFLRELDTRTRSLESLVADSTAMISNTGQMLDRAQTLSGMVGQNAQSLVDASADWDETIARAEVLSAKTQAAALEVSASAERMTGALDQTRKLMEAAANGGLITKVEGLVSHILVSVALLMVFFFALLLGYKVLVSRLARKTV